MIILGSPPSRDTRLVTDRGFSEQRLHGWMQEIANALNQAWHPVNSQIIDPSRGDAELIYTNGVLTRIEYDDSSVKELAYTDGLVTELTDTAGANMAFDYRGGQLVGIRYPA